MKQSYAKSKKKQLEKRFGHSSYLTPESVQYLNDAIKKSSSRLDDELIYAGLHSELEKGPKFKRTEKNK